MGLFGGKFGPVTLPNMTPGFGGGVAPAVSPPTPPMATGRGIFGRAMKGIGGMDHDKIAMILAGLSDAGGTLAGRPGGQALASMMSQQRDRAAKKAQQDAFQAAFDPATGKLDPGKFVAALSAGGGELPEGAMTALMKPEDPLLEQRQGLMEAQAEAARQQAASAQALAEQREALTPAQIAAYQALAGQRQNQGDYYGARARQPYAPQRPRAAGGGRPISPNSVKWD